MRTIDTVKQLVSGTVEALGYELADEQGQWVLTLYIDKENGITLDDCERVSRAVEPLLDQQDPIEQMYFLSVSSLGLDRPIKTDRDFDKNINKKITVKLYAPLNHQKEFMGILTDFDSERFTISDGIKEPISILRKDAAIIKPYIEF